MKLLLKIVTVVLFLFVVIPMPVLVAMHFRPHAGRLVATVEIDRPRQQVWSWLSEPRKVTRWVGWLTAVEADPSTPAEGVGHRETWVMGDPHAAKPMRIPAEFTAWDPPHAMSGRIVYPQAFDGEFTYTLDDLGNRTRVTQVSDWHYSGFGWLMEPLVTPEAQKKMMQDIGRMKALVEAEPLKRYP